MSNPPSPKEAGLPERILLLDDEPSVVLALKLLLQALKFTVKEFTEPALALKYLEQQEANPQVFLCDLKMPGLDGQEVLKRSKVLRPDLPFILMSAHATPEEVASSRAEGASGFLAKPFSPDQLYQALEGVKEEAPE